MADRESILKWLSAKKYRVVDENHPCRRIVERLIEEGRAEWLCCANRVRIRGRSALLALALLTSTVAAHAETRDAPLDPGTEFYSTSFAFYVRAPKPFAKALDTTSAARVAIDLPLEFAGWRCYRTPESSTAKLNFENVACWHGEFTTGISVSCHTDRESHDAKSFFLRAPGGVEVQISGVCMTTFETVRYDDGF